MDLKKSARDDASSEKYSQDQSHFTDWELRAHTHVITKYVKETYNSVNEFIFKTHESLRSVDRTILESNILGVSKKLEARLDQEKSVFTDKFLSVAKDKVSSDKTYRSFILSNELQDRKPSYHHSRVRFWAILVAILFAESFLNAHFLSKGSELGYIGGFITALIISIVNLSVGATCGELVRNINHRDTFRKILGWFVPLLSICLAGALALLIGHYRDALESDPFEAAVLAVPAFLNAPFGLVNINSWILFSISLVSFGGAALDRFSCDDVYPNYGNLHRDKEAKDKELTRKKEEIYINLSKIIQDSQAELNSKHLEVKEACEFYESSIRKSENLGKSYDSYLNQVNDTYFSLVNQYRSDFSYVANYELDAFSTAPSLNLSEVSRIDEDSIELDKKNLPSIQSLKSGLPGLFEKVETIIDKKASELDETVDRYISDLVKKAEQTK
ncbi:MAG: hypothetical protein RPS47_07575 [Colwellia sp.]